MGARSRPRRAKWPRPLASREYLYARRVWDRPADGGCYCVAAAVDVQPPACMKRTRTVRVRDFASCFVIRGAQGRQTGGVLGLVT